MLRGLYDWVVHWTGTPYGGWALGFLSFSESSFFPIPPDVLLMALAVGSPSRAFEFALVCSMASILGGVFGYFIGYKFYEVIGKRVIEFYGVSDKFDYVSEKYKKNAFAAIAIAGFTPIPYKVFTIAAGACRVKLTTLLSASALSRPARFFLVAGLIYLFGPQIKAFIDKYFNLLSIAFVVLLIGGFIVVRYCSKRFGKTRSQAEAASTKGDKA